MFSVHSVTKHVTQWEGQQAFHHERMLVGLPREWDTEGREGTD